VKLSGRRLPWGLALVWIGPALLPGWLLLSRRAPPPVPADPGPGHGWLALPAGMAAQPDPLASWDCLGAAAPAPPPADPEPPPPPPAPPPAPFRITVSGRVVEAEQTLYCLLDTESGRWFRLAEGEADAPAGVAIETGGPHGPPLLRDLRSGASLPLQPSLSAVSPEAPIVHPVPSLEP